MPKIPNKTGVHEKTVITDPILTFRKDRFILENIVSLNMQSKLARDPHWTQDDLESASTRDLGAAVGMRGYGDERVERIFQRTLQARYLPRGLPPLPGLDPHQREGIRWILSRKRSYLAHAPGAGKTAQAIIAACLSIGEGQTLFIVPPSLVLNWEREIYKFTEWLGIFPTIGLWTAERIGKPDILGLWADFIILADSILSRDGVQRSLQLMRPKFIAVDEASRFKESTSVRTISLFGGRTDHRSFPGIFQDAKHTVLLDGSPMPNRPIELWAPTYALDPEAIDCKGYDDFGYRYCGAKPNAFGQWEYRFSSHEEELKCKLRRDFMHVVTEDELSHPERLRSMVVMSEDVRTPEIKNWERANLVGIDNVDWHDPTVGEIARVRRELGIRKVPWVARYVRERLEEKNESILLFCWHRDVASGLLNTLHLTLGAVCPTIGFIVGGDSVRSRETSIDRFQQGKDRLLIMNIAAAGRGVNLQRADRVIFAEFSWTDETNRQAEKRASRKGSTRSHVRCEYIVAPHSMDEIVLRSLFTKEKRVRRVIG